MSQSPALALPYLQPAQALKHITHNEALSRLDRLTQMRVASFDLSEPPDIDSRSDSHLYWTGDTPTKDWAKFPRHLALWDGTVWQFIRPDPGFLCTIPGTAEVHVFDGSVWAAVAGVTPDMDGIKQLGVNSTADDTNRFSVAADASLFNHEGTDHRLIINRQSSSDTATVLFQTDYTGSAEFGLSGSTDFSLKCSADGINYREALSVDTATATIRIGGTTRPAHLNINGGLSIRQTNPSQSSTPTVFDITASGTTGGPYTLTRFFSFSPASWQGNYFMAYRARGLEEAPQAAQTGDLIYAIDSYAHDGETAALAARLGFYTDGNPAAGLVGGKIILSLADGQGTQANAGDAQVLTIGPDKTIRANGAATFAGPIGFPQVPISALPTANPAGQMLFVTDGATGASPAYSDGTVWRSVIDGAIIT